MKRYATILVLALLTCLPTLAQQREGGRPQFNPEEFKTQMRNYIREKANLTQQEAEAVFPIYAEMKQKQMEYNGQIRLLKMPFPPKDGNQCKEAVEQITVLSVKLAQLEKEYYAKMCKVIDAKKVYNIILAEDAFHREMLQNANRGLHRGGQGGFGQRGGQGFGQRQGGWNGHGHGGQKEDKK